jgi:hypothetical protein
MKAPTMTINPAERTEPARRAAGADVLQALLELAV